MVVQAVEISWRENFNSQQQYFNREAATDRPKTQECFLHYTTGSTMYSGIASAQLAIIASQSGDIGEVEIFH